MLREKPALTAQTGFSRTTAVLNPELELQLQGDLVFAPLGVLSRDSTDELDVFAGDPWPTRLALRLPAPEPLVASPVPREDGLGLHDHEGVLPARPVAPKPDPEESISPLELGAGHLPSVDAELLTKRGYLQQKVSSGSGCRAEGQDENPKGSKHGERAAIRERDRQRSWRGWGFRGPRPTNRIIATASKGSLYGLQEHLARTGG
jgi:hypothetical protein